MDIYWKDVPYPVFLNTETIDYNKAYNHFMVKSINLSAGRDLKKTTWSRRMLDVLERIEEEYVFILIEDFFLRERVQTELLEQILNQMDENPLMSQVQLFGTRTNCDKGITNELTSDMEMRQIGDEAAKVCFVPTIWRKSVLQKWLRPHETIWAFESCGAKRAKRWKYPETVYRVYSPSIFNYLWEKECYCVVNGKWMIHPLLTELFEQNNIVIDYSKRGTITMEEWNQVTMLSIVKRNGFLGTLKKVISRIKSIY